eukprot:Gregarina_sp_Poly_1__5934@NODE_3125_length_1357_cov_431_407752_g1985_i0_p2_GENE_NODE_3125_length_1357_cov_431_407752_g1985_i0NODE_3125_length_1357_cov_431_407752_g1985_i0_p2_ORF_typecomplete_len118_score5_91_NODE_3125_length_1357_cov_431_407752_g1985_i09071260
MSIRKHETTSKSNLFVTKKIAMISVLRFPLRRVSDLLIMRALVQHSLLCGESFASGRLQSSLLGRFQDGGTAKLTLRWSLDETPVGTDPRCTQAGRFGFSSATDQRDDCKPRYKLHW